MRTHHQQGSILLYSLLVISLLTAIAVTISIIVINELKLTSSAADASMAFYAADSGIERGLYTVSARRNDSSATLSQTLLEIQAMVELPYAFENLAKYSNGLSATKTSKISNEEVLQDHYIQADYYDGDSPLAPDANRLVHSVTIQNSASNPSSWAEVSWTAWDKNGTLGTSDNARVVIGPTDLQNGWSFDLDVFSSIPVGYRVRIRALFGDLGGLSVTPYYLDTSVNPPELKEVTDLPSHIVIKSVGTRGNFKQSLTATVPWKVPLFGLYDYVLYSEGDILKNIILSQPVYSSGTIQIESNIIGVPPFSCGTCAACRTAGWLAFAAPACIDPTTCSINSASPSYCTLGASNASFTLPIPTTVPNGPAYYISLRYKVGASGVLETTINDPNEGELGLTSSYTSNADWVTCTIPESFALSSATNRTIQFLHNIASPLMLDWYQLTTYKVFNDCSG